MRIGASIGGATFKIVPDSWRTRWSAAGDVGGAFRASLRSTIFARFRGQWVFMTDADGDPRPRNWMIRFLEAGFRYRL